MSKSIVFPVVLKTIISHVHADDKSFALNDKQIRSRLRAKFNDAHVKNTSWIATNMREYDALRSTFDTQYRATLERRAKRTTKTNVTPRKRNAKTNVVVTSDANENA